MGTRYCPDFCHHMWGQERERGDICTRHHMWTVYPVCTCVLLVFRLLGRDTLPDFQGSFSPLAPHSQELLQEDTADTQKSWSNRKSFRFLVCNHQCFLFAVPLSFYQFTVSDDFWWICPFHWIYYNSWGRKTEGPNRKIPQSFAVCISIDFHRDSFVSFFFFCFKRLHQLHWHRGCVYRVARATRVCIMKGNVGVT